MPSARCANSHERKHASVLLSTVTYAITALGLLDLVYFCVVLSTGQLPSQIFHPVRIMVLLRRAFPKGSEVSLDNVIGRYFPDDTGLTL